MAASGKPNRVAKEAEAAVRAILQRAKAVRKYSLRVRVASEGRSDRLVPLLAQAILEAASAGKRPLAVVAAPRIAPPVAEQLLRFASEHARGAAIGIVDLEGLRHFTSPELAKFNLGPARRRVKRAAQPPLPDLFSDLNQWLLKILLGQALPEDLITVPRELPRNAAHLARLAGVSVMTASRCVKQLASQGFLDDDGEHLQVVRIPELLDQWMAANRNNARIVAARWRLARGREQLVQSLRNFDFNSGRCCGALFFAAGALGFPMVHGVPPSLYLDSLRPQALARLGVTTEPSNRPPDLYIRVPSHPEAIFRASVQRSGVPVTDILQTWLDVAADPARGREQADEIRRRALKPLFKR